MPKEPVLRRLGNSERAFNVERFIEQGVPALGGESTNTPGEELDPKGDDTRKDRPARIESVGQAQHAPANKIRKTTASYKHNEANYLRLKRMSQKLSAASGEPRTMGDMIDEALELMFPKWKAEISALPPEPDL